VVSPLAISQPNGSLPNAAPVVVVIDPDPVARAGTRALLRGVGIESLTFDSAESYLLTSRRDNIGCLIVDVLLPGMSGLELLRRLRSSGDPTPIIMVADESDVATAVTAMREGASDFIEKPIAGFAVVRQVQKVLHGGMGGMLA